MRVACQGNRIEFRYGLSEVWYSSSENMVYLKQHLDKEFIMPLKSNCEVALSAEDKRWGV